MFGISLFVSSSLGMFGMRFFMFLLQGMLNMWIWKKKVTRACGFYSSPTVFHAFLNDAMLGSFCF